MSREQFSCFAISRTLSPIRSITRISTACSWVNIDGTAKAVILAQGGHFYFGAVGQYYSGANTFPDVSSGISLVSQVDVRGRSHGHDYGRSGGGAPMRRNIGKLGALAACGASSGVRSSMRLLLHQFDCLNDSRPGRRYSGR